MLEGGREVLRRVRPVLIVEQVAEAAALYGGDSQGLFDLLEELGYVIFAVTGEGPYVRSEFGASPLVVNWLATPADRP